MSDSEHDDSSDEQQLLSSSDDDSKKGYVDDDDMIIPTAFDAYFTQFAARAVTSANVFSQIVSPLSADEYRQAIADVPPHKLKSSVLSDPNQGAIFRQMMLQLRSGFNILCYGFGSKRVLLNRFATEHCAKSGSVVVVNGFQPEFSLKGLFNSIDTLPGIIDLPITSSSPESHAHRINQFFSDNPSKHLYLIVHNIDSPSLRTARAKSCLAIIALNPSIHIIASVDNINSPLLWSTAESSARKDGTAFRGFAWLWHDLTTLASYDFELAFADHSSISALQGRKRDAGVVELVQGSVSETAALHVLAAVTQKAKKLFAQMGASQLEAMQQSDNSNDAQQFAQSFDSLFNRARDNFIATNDGGFRTLLGEFRDHGLIQTAQGAAGSGEMLWIPMRHDRLSKVLRSLEDET